jgi:hypothetical protein
LRNRPRLFVEPGAVAWTALLIFAQSVSSALFLVADLSQPFVGSVERSDTHHVAVDGSLNN